MSKEAPAQQPLDGSEFSFAIVASRFNEGYVNQLLDNCRETLVGAGVRPDAVTIERVPGTFEIPYVAMLLAQTGSFDAVIGLGLVFQGETSHADLIGQSVTEALMRIGLETEIPAIHGVIVVDNEEQAAERCSGKLNRGVEFGHAALEMANLKNRYAPELENELDWMSGPESTN